MDEIGKPKTIFNEDEEAKLIYNADIIQHKRNGKIVQSETKRNKLLLLKIKMYFNVKQKNTTIMMMMMG